MYRHCIYCSADLGANESVEQFPIGRSLAFDAAKGRLWAVCPKCARWNLAPIEERWEAIEQAEKLFADSRLRAQSENVGLARLRDGTRLVRVGEALVGELAAWRYGEQLIGRRRKYLLATGAAVLGVTALAGLQFAGVIGGAMGVFHVGRLAWMQRQATRPVHHLPPGGPGGESGLLLRRRDLNGAMLSPDGGEGVRLVLPGVYLDRVPVRVELDGAQATTVLARAMVLANRRGAKPETLNRGLGVLADAGSAERFVRQMAEKRRAIGTLAKHHRPSARWGWANPEEAPVPMRAMSDPEALALEMALHEESERRALHGELALLESAWREAEEIASIADGLATAAALGPSTETA